MNANEQENAIHTQNNDQWLITDTKMTEMIELAKRCSNRSDKHPPCIRKIKETTNMMRRMKDIKRLKLNFRDEKKLPE